MASPVASQALYRSVINWASASLYITFITFKVFLYGINGNFLIKRKMKSMHPHKNNFAYFLLGCFILLGCNNAAQYKSPAGYDINKPEKFLMPQSLKEISGIAFLKGNSDTIFAIEDEDGKLYFFSPETEKTSYSKFGKKGDYEDVAVLNNSTFAVLKSDGSILLFPAAETGKEKIDSVQGYENVLPKGEYEGLFAADDKLYALCKNCSGDKEEKEVSVYMLDPFAGGGLSVAGSFKIDLSMIQPEEGKGKMKFHPSCIAKNPVTNEWYIVSSVNKMLLVLDAQWKIKGYFPLDPSLFKQPEGLAFSAKGDMYISNEGGDGYANILLFRYSKN